MPSLRCSHHDQGGQMGESYAGSRRWKAAVGVVAVLAIGACPLTWTTGQPPVVNLQFAQDSTECGKQAASFTISAKRSAFIVDCLRRFQMVHALRVPIHRLAELNLLIPEFHDEQPFANSATEYGPVAMGFASPFLGGFVADSQWGEHGARGVLSALVMVDPLDTRPLGASYQRLGLHTGVNCLWVTSPATSVDSWKAYMTWPTFDGACEPSVNRQNLGVVRMRAGIGDLVPAVTRFTWDENGRPLIGVRCLNGWCDVGPGDAAGIPTFTPTSHIAGVSVAERAQLVGLLGGTTALEVPGWYDEQPLSGFDATGRAVPGTLWATVLPVHRTYMPLSLIVNDDQPEAILFVHGNAVGAPYGTGGNWDVKPGINIIAWHQANAGSPLTVTSRSPAAGATVTWANAHRHLHLDAPVIPTARFRWSSADDGIWVACGQACCRVDGKG